MEDLTRREAQLIRLMYAVAIWHPDFYPADEDEAADLDNELDELPNKLGV
jgi:hypothetical protein